MSQCLGLEEAFDAFVMVDVNVASSTSCFDDASLPFMTLSFNRPFSLEEVEKLV